MKTIRVCASCANPLMPQNNIQKKQWRENYRPTAQVLQWPVCRLRRCHSAPSRRRSVHCTPWAHVSRSLGAGKGGRRGVILMRGIIINRMFSGLLIVFTLFSLYLVQAAMAKDVIRLPKTGQTKCYDTSGKEISCKGTGQDADVQEGVDWPNPRFTVSGECVTHNLTGLMWAKNANLPNGKKTWQGALDYVAAMNSGSGFCGYKNWRLPNINELESLVNIEMSNTGFWLVSQGFSMGLIFMSDCYYGSTTTVAAFDFLVWEVDMCGNGVSTYRSKGGFRRVWIVLSGQSKNPDTSYPANIYREIGTATI